MLAVCGIAGFVGMEPNKDADWLRTTAQFMAGAVHHRGPDDGGTWTDSDASVALGHRRLSIVDVSPLGHQPMASADGRWILVYNGELYNSQELRIRLEGRGTRLRGTSDTEVLLEHLAAYGIEATLAQVDGMFAFGAWDRRRRILVLARDRVGEKPLYWGWQGKSMLFGSELAALRRHPDFRGSIDRAAAAGMLRYGFVPGPYSIYEGIGKLPQGSFVEVDPSRPGVEQVRTYWSFREVAELESRRRPTRTDVDVIDELERLLRDAVRSRMVADVPLGAFLSGGIDSSTIVAMMQAQSSEPVKTFTVGFQEQSYDEASHARQVAHHLGTEHTELYVSPKEALDVVPLLPSIFDEPFADVSQIPTYLLSVLARERVKVALSGDGGDELFGGYTRHTFHRRVWGRLGRVPAPLRSAAARVIQRVPPGRWDAAANHLRAVLPAAVPTARLGEKMQRGAALLAASDPEHVYRPLRSHWNDPTVALVEASEHSDPALDPAHWASLTDPTERLMFLDSITYLPDDVLVKVDRAAMATSLETRVPLLAPSVVSYAWSLAVEEKIRNGQGKWPLRAVLHRYVPPALVDRPKMGFGVPVGEWLRGPLRQWGEDLLHPDALRRGGLVDSRAVHERWNQHQSGARDWSFALWDVLMLVAWHGDHQASV